MLNGCGRTEVIAGIRLAAPTSWTELRLEFDVVEPEIPKPSGSVSFDHRHSGFPITFATHSTMHWSPLRGRCYSSTYNSPHTRLRAQPSDQPLVGHDTANTFEFERDW